MIPCSLESSSVSRFGELGEGWFCAMRIDIPFLLARIKMNLFNSNSLEDETSKFTIDQSGVDVLALPV